MRLTALLAAVLTAACAARVDPPRAIVLDQIQARPASRAEFVHDYEGAMISIAAITERELGLPRLQGVLHLVPDRDAFYDVLASNGADPATARGAADTMVAVGSDRAIYVNQAAFARLNWNARLAVLSHEAAHVVQYELSGGRRGASEQWLREGFADWVQAHVLEKLQVGTMTRENILRRNARFISQPAMREQLPPLSTLGTFAEWVVVANGPAGTLLYPYAFVATDFLIGRHSVDDVVTYFGLFAISDDPLANFQRAFGEDRSAFDAALRDHVSQLK